MTLLRSSFTFKKKKGSHLLKHYNIIFESLGGFTFFRGELKFNNMLYNSDLFETESYSSYKCATKSPYVWSVGNSLRAVDNVQSDTKSLFKQHEDL